MSKKEYSQEEIARFERIRLYEIDKTKKEIEEFKKELETEKSKFLKSSNKISQLEKSIKEKEDALMRLEHQTGYDLLVEQDRSTISKFAENINISSIGSAMEMVGSVIPIPGVSGLVKSLGKTIKKTKNGK